jgi:hypothetical protein
MRGRRSAVCTHSSGTKLSRRNLSQYRFVSAHASPSPRRLEPAQPEVFALTVFRRDLVSQDISIRSRSPCPAIIFISEPDHPRSRTRSAKCSRMPPQHCCMPSGLPSNWCEAANRQMHRRFSKFRYPNWAAETAACYAPPNIAGCQFSSLPERWADPRQVSSNPLPGERANAPRPRSVRVGCNIAARNRRVRTRKPHNRALGQQAQPQGWPLPPAPTIGATRKP